MEVLQRNENNRPECDKKLVGSCRLQKGIRDLYLSDQPEPGGGDGDRRAPGGGTVSERPGRSEVAHPGKRKARVTGRDAIPGGHKFCDSVPLRQGLCPLPWNLSRFCDRTVTDQTAEATLCHFWPRPSEIGSFHFLSSH